MTICGNVSRPQPVKLPILGTSCVAQVELTAADVDPLTAAVTS